MAKPRRCAICDEPTGSEACTLCRQCAASYDRQRRADCTIDGMLRWAGARARKAALTQKEK